MLDLLVPVSDLLRIINFEIEDLTILNMMLINESPKLSYVLVGASARCG